MLSRVREFCSSLYRLARPAREVAAPASDARIKVIQKERDQLKTVVRMLTKRHYRDFAMPPEHLRLNVGTNTTEGNFWAQGISSSTRVLHVFGKAPVGPILDWGCGSGRTLRWLLAYPAWCEYYHGTDVDKEAVEWLRAQGQQNLTACNDAPPLPYGDQTFLGIFSFSVLTHIPPEKHRLWYAELHRVLRKGGLAYLTMMGPAGPMSDIGEKAKGELSRRGHVYLLRQGHYKNASIVTEAFARQQLEGLFAIEEFKERGYQNMDVYRVRRLG
jgi:SAM-dependent methyltransferase